MMAASLNEQKIENNREMKVVEYISEKTIVLLKERHKSEVLDALVAMAAGLGLVADVPLFRSAIDTREAFCSTAIGDEIAIPHAKIPGIDSFFVITAVMLGAVEWDAPDQKPVRIIFLIGG
ncbi:MAG: PTS sugar transporter subunit IIA, partial [Candidatus Omnitrophota bacterium]